MVLAGPALDLLFLGEETLELGVGFLDHVGRLRRLLLAHRRLAEGSTPVNPEELPEGAEAENTPIIKEADPELERLLAEEEDIERRTRQHHEAPKFHSGDSD